MALRKCPDCGIDVSTSPPACPKCGHSVTAHSVIIFTLIFMAIVFLLGGGALLWLVHFPPAGGNNGALLVEPFVFIRKTGLALVAFGLVVAVSAIAVARRLKTHL